jgi:hypothetical protein
MDGSDDRADTNRMRDDPARERESPPADSRFPLYSKLPLSVEGGRASRPSEGVRARRGSLVLHGSACPACCACMSGQSLGTMPCCNTGAGTPWNGAGQEGHRIIVSLMQRLSSPILFSLEHKTPACPPLLLQLRIGG